jgi:hypothetical protein
MYQIQEALLQVQPQTTKTCFFDAQSKAACTCKQLNARKFV